MGILPMMGLAQRDWTEILGDQVVDDVTEVPINDKVSIAPCPEYTPPGTRENLWDWDKARYNVCVTNDDNFATYECGSICSPFYYCPGTQNENTSHLIGAGDQEGWELLFRKLGDDENPVYYPSFGLYNPATATVRVFFYLIADDNFNEALVAAKHDVLPRESGPSLAVSGIFEHLNIPANVLNEFDASGLALAQINELGGRGGRWTMLEFITSYDPCVCKATSFVSFEPAISSITEVNLETEGTGNSEAVYNSQAPSDNKFRYTLGAGLSYLDGLSGRVESGYKRYKTLAEYESAVGDGNETGLEEEAIDFVSAVFSVLGPAGTASKILGFFFGKPGQAGTLTGFNHNYYFDTGGTTVTTTGLPGAQIFTPGSFYDATDEATIENVPYYDNPLGLFALLEKPVVEVAKGGPGTERLYRCVGPFKYTVNPFSGLGIPVQIEGALVWEDGCSSGFFAAPSIGLECIADYGIRFDAVAGPLDPLSPADNPQFCTGTPALQITAVFADGSVFSARYKTSLVEADYTIAEAPVTVLSPAATSPAICTGLVEPVEDWEVALFCATQYDPRTTKAKTDLANTESGEAMEVGINAHELKVYPNPINDHLALKLPLTLIGKRCSFTLHNALGQVVWQRRDYPVFGRQISFYGEFDLLPPGNYHLRLTSSGWSAVSTIMKQ